MQVERSRRRVFTMLAIMAFWAMLPVSACLRLTGSMAQDACCQKMVQACESPAMNASSSCCLVHPQRAAVAPVFADAADHLQTVSVVSHPAGASVTPGTDVEQETFLTPAPSISSSAGNSILRI
jgi:hypothetical protein